MKGAEKITLFFHFCPCLKQLDRSFDCLSSTSFKTIKPTRNNQLKLLVFLFLFAKQILHKFTLAENMTLHVSIL